MERIVRFSFGMLALCTLLGCASSSVPKPQSVTSADADFSTYDTFGWQTADGEASDKPPLTIVDSNVQAAIRAQLLARGYVENNDNPDFRVSYETRTYYVEKKKNPVSIGFGVGTFGGNVGSSVGASVPVGGGSEENAQEQLMIRALQPQSGKELWVGTSTSENKQGFDAAAVNKAVAATMEGFPAKGG